MWNKVSQKSIFHYCNPKHKNADLVHFNYNDRFITRPLPTMRQANCLEVSRVSFRAGKSDCSEKKGDGMDTHLQLVVQFVKD